MKSIAVITYDRAHRKTYDVLIRLALKGYKPILLLLPYHKRKSRKPLFPHRPATPPNTPHPYEIAQHFNWQWVRVNDYIDMIDYIRAEDRTLIAGCGILPPEVVNAGTIINAHPGYLPMARGLDSLKWSILKGYPIGVTTHIIDEQVDMGYLIERRVLS